MAIITVDARTTFQDGDLVFLELTQGGQSVTMTTHRAATLEELAHLILAQKMPAEPDRTFQRRITIDAHQETEIDPETDEEFIVWIVDDVTMAQLTDEAAREGYENLLNWATWTADEAASWIETNVTDLTSAKLALVQMAKAITFLRDWRR